MSARNKNSGVHQLSLVGYPMIYKVFSTIPGDCRISEASTVAAARWNARPPTLRFLQLLELLLVSWEITTKNQQTSAGTSN